MYYYIYPVNLVQVHPFLNLALAAQSRHELCLDCYTYYIIKTLMRNMVNIIHVRGENMCRTDSNLIVDK